MIKIANAPCSWGVLEFELEGQAAGYEQVLDEMKESGYAGTELGDWGFMPTDPKALRAEMDKRGFQLLGAFVPVLLKDRTKHAEGAERAARTARLMADAGFPNAFIVLADENGSIAERTANAGRITPAMGLTDDEWKVFAEGAHAVAREVKAQTGLRTVFHHHCAGYVETPEEVDTLLRLTDPELLGLVLDMGHYMFGGGNPLEALKKYGNRIWHVHFKDCDPAIAVKSRNERLDYFQSVKAGIFCELGKGGVDFRAIVDELHRQGYEDWIVVEQDVLPGMGNPKACAQRNRGFIGTLSIDN
ncbi:MAG: sugar phosphate isomerase/epimerase [Tannerella sp.]|jgi:inosose dehydratase|nr:sugar phosphate isomerase/epimerase [Tannerella sp.]